MEGLPALAEELVRLKVDAIVASTTPSIKAARKATNTIPIVMSTVGDPVEAGFVVSFARPGGNITGRTTQAPELMGKRVQLFYGQVDGQTDQSSTMIPKIQAAADTVNQAWRKAGNDKHPPGHPIHDR